MLDKKPKKKLNTRKIFIIFLVIIGILIFIAVSLSKPIVPSKKVEGASIKINTQDLKSAVEDKIQTIQNEASGVNVSEIASSSPQVQKIINDIKSLEGYPSNHAKSMCENICSGL